MVAALYDWLLRHCHIVNIRGNGFRMMQQRALASSLAPEPAFRAQEHLPWREEDGPPAGRVLRLKVRNTPR